MSRPPPRNLTWELIAKGEQLAPSGTQSRVAVLEQVLKVVEVLRWTTPGDLLRHRLSLGHVFEVEYVPAVVQQPERVGGEGVIDRPRRCIGDRHRLWLGPSLSEQTKVVVTA